MDRHGNSYHQDYLNQNDLNNRMALMGIGAPPASNLNQINAPPPFQSHGLEVRGPSYGSSGVVPATPLPVSAYEYMNEKNYNTAPQRFPQNPRGPPRPFINGPSSNYPMRNPSGSGSPPQFVASFDGSGGSPGNIPLKSTTLFVGDLSVLCDEEKLFDLFHKFGKIESIQLKKSDIDHQRAHLSYGFIKFFTHESAANALEQLNGMPYLGRNLRVGWADDHPANHYAHSKPVMNTVPPKKNTPTAQIHVTFVSKNVHQPISELDLRNIFEKFGNVVDVAIKKSVFNKELGIQSGYGFIHFALTDEGIQSALAAVDEVNHTVINFISFECTVTHGLKTYLFSLRSRGAGGGGVGGAVGVNVAPQASPFNTYNNNGNVGGGPVKIMRDVDRLPSAYYAAPPPQPPMTTQSFGGPHPLMMPPPHVAQYSQQQHYPAAQFPPRAGSSSYSPPPNRNMHPNDFVREPQPLPPHAYYHSSSLSSMTSMANEGGISSSFNQASSPNSASTSTYSLLNNVPYNSSVLTTSSTSTYDMNNLTVVEERHPIDFDDVIESSFEKPKKVTALPEKKTVSESDDGLQSPNQDN